MFFLTNNVRRAFLECSPKLKTRIYSIQSIHHGYHPLAGPVHIVSPVLFMITTGGIRTDSKNFIDAYDGVCLGGVNLTTSLMWLISTYCIKWYQVHLINGAA
jgi:hypothetical protein